MSSSQPIIILGMPRSGTTLMRRILNSHPAISCPGETFVLRSIARFLESESVSEGIDYGPIGGLGSLGYSEKDVHKRLRELCFGIYEEIAASENKKRFAIKTAVDSFHVENFESVLAGHVKFVCVLRHGLDIVCSFRDFCEKLECNIAEIRPYLNNYPRPYEAYAHAWVDVTNRLLDLAKCHPEDVHILKYEDLVGDTLPRLEELFSFLEEPLPDNLISETFKVTEVKGLGDWKTYMTNSISQKNVGRWRELEPRIVQALGEIANPTLLRAGYDPIETSMRQDVALEDSMRRHEIAMMLQQARSHEAAEG